MRIAIIGYPGAGKTTLASALAGVVGVRPTRSLDDLAGADRAAQLILDGLPETLEDLARIDELVPDGLDQVLFLDTAAEVRLRRVSRMVVAGTDAATARARMLRPPALRAVRAVLEASGRLTTIDANGSRTEVMAGALEVLGIDV